MRRRLFVAFYFQEAAPQDWTSPQNGALWRDGAKTLFDPCPAGWRVPRSGKEERSPWSAFMIYNSSWTGGEIDAQGSRIWDEPVVYGGKSRYSPAGVRIPERSDVLVWVGKDCHITTSTCSGGEVHRFYTTKISVEQTGSYVRSRAVSVRCVRL